MRKPIALVLAALSLTGASGLQAQAQDEPANLPQVSIHQQATYKLAPQEFETYRGTYRFDSGETLTLWQQGRRYFSQLRGQAGQELLPKAPGEFESSTGAQIRFQDDGRTVTVTHYEQLAVAPGESERLGGLSGNTMVAHARPAR